MAVKIIQYKWAGAWGPFRITTPCGECSATEGVIRDVIEREFSGEDISFETREWLSEWWKPLLRGGWHAPITTVNGKVISQGTVLDAGLLAYHIRRELVRGYAVPAGANIVFSKPGCPHCARVKGLLKKKGVAYEERDIIRNPLFAHQMFALTKKLFPRSKPVTTPQVWLDGTYVGGADEVERLCLGHADTTSGAENAVAESRGEREGEMRESIV